MGIGSQLLLYLVGCTTPIGAPAKAINAGVHEYTRSH